MTINKVTVAGAGTMGAQLAALFVNAGLKVILFRYCSGPEQLEIFIAQKILR